jgi:hypothetical protein
VANIHIDFRENNSIGSELGHTQHGARINLFVFFKKGELVEKIDCV